MCPQRLPEGASRFFSEGMEQMEALDYPPHARKVVEKYHSQWPVDPSLHKHRHECDPLLPSSAQLQERLAGAMA
jgi:hypothetical protein